jgi:hypothetical protein
MNILNHIIKNNYSCFNCQTIFESEKELSVFWFCSGTCKFNYAFRIVKKTFPLADFGKMTALANQLAEVSF